MIWLIIIIILILVGYRIYETYRKSSLHTVVQAVDQYMKENEEVEQRKALLIQQHQQLIDELKQIDANFSYTAFEQLVKKTCQWAMEAKSTHHQEAIGKLRQYASASFLNDYVHDLQKLKMAGECSYRNVIVEEMIMKEVKHQNQYDIILVDAMVRYDYATYHQKRLLRQKEMKSILKLTYSKEKEKIGIEQEYEAITHCPNCGAAIDVIHDKKCPYCDSYYYTKTNIWMLHELRELPQDQYGLS